jgi:AmmeMemoRadiSam system protein B
MEVVQNVRPSPIAGQWYNSDPKRLANQVDNYINDANLPEITGEVIGVMSPHAGHRYSGPVAGYAFGMLEGMQPEIVAIISPMHYPYYEPLLTTAHQAYATPLGTIPVDEVALENLDTGLKKELGFGLEKVANDTEHSLEIELPFLQRAIKSPFTLVPVMVRDQSYFVMERLGLILAHILKDRQTLLVASTDLSHFYPQAIANKLDHELLRQVEAFSPAGVIQAEENGKGFACGRGALASVMVAAKALGANQAKILNYATSGDVTGDFSQVVGYGAAVFLKSANPVVSSN